MTISTEGSLALSLPSLNLNNAPVQQRTTRIRLHTWNIFNKVISLHLKGSHFLYHVIDQQTGADEGWGGLNSNHTLTLQERSLELIKALPIMSNDDLDFVPAPQCHEIMLLGYKVHLLLIQKSKRIFGDLSMKVPTRVFAILLIQLQSRRGHHVIHWIFLKIHIDILSVS